MTPPSRKEILSDENISFIYCLWKIIFFLKKYVNPFIFIYFL